MKSTYDMLTKFDDEMKGANVDLGKTGALELFFNDGTVFARYTSERGLNASLVGRKFEGLQSLAEAEHGESGTFVRKSVFDGTRRIYSWRKVAGFPLVGVAALATAMAVRGALAGPITLTSSPVSGSMAVTLTVLPRTTNSTKISLPGIPHLPKARDPPALR